MGIIRLYRRSALSQDPKVLFTHPLPRDRGLAPGEVKPGGIASRLTGRMNVGTSSSHTMPDRFVMSAFFSPGAMWVSAYDRRIHHRPLRVRAFR